QHAEVQSKCQRLAWNAHQVKPWLTSRPTGWDPSRKTQVAALFHPRTKHRISPTPIRPQAMETDDAKDAGTDPAGPRQPPKCRRVAAMRLQRSQEFPLARNAEFDGADKFGRQTT